jgi:hypothetical protein
MTRSLPSVVRCLLAGTLVAVGVVGCGESTSEQAEDPLVVDTGVDADATDAGGDIDVAGRDVANCESLRQWYLDDDGDGYGRAEATKMACDKPEGHVARGGDCDDSDPERHPEAAEQCDGVDDNCNGEVDELLGRRCDKYKGVCRQSTGACVDGQYETCSPSDYGPDYERDESSCDGLDNDCDGEVDEGLTESCDKQEGVCAGASTRCVDGRYFSCDYRDYGPDYERDDESSCDGLDNDCDGTVDEQLERECSNQKGVCEGATSECSDGTYAACEKPQYGESYEVDESTCDNLDNDCDGTVDEHLTAVCGKQKGVCSGATVACDDFGKFPTCDDRQYGSDYQQTETCCDGLDNDCDGVTDPDSAGCGSQPAGWTRLLGTSGADDLEAVSGDDDGNLYAAGQVRGSLAGQSYGGGGDGVVAKYDRSGTRTWVRLLGGSGTERIEGMATDDQGETYVVGKATDAFAGESYSGGRLDAFIAKYDASGNRQWVEMFGAYLADRAEDVSTDGQGNVYVVGTAGARLGNASYHGAKDAFLAKYDSSGNRQWVAALGTRIDDKGVGVATDGAGKAYVVGETERGFGGQSYAGGDWDGFVAKYDETGARSWVRLLGTSKTDKAWAVAADGQGDVYVGGLTHAGLGGRSFNGGSYDGFVAKYDTSGNRSWVRLVGGNDAEIVEGLAVDGQGDVHLAGTAGGAMGGQIYNGGYWDALAATYEATGTRTNTQLLGRCGEDRAYGVVVDDRGELYLVGETDLGLDGQTYNGGDHDGFLSRMK